MSQSGLNDAAVSELPPETQTKHELSEWLIANGLDVAWEQENPFGYDVFHVDDTPEKPDLIIDQPLGNTIAVETKDGGEKSATYDALLQTHRYWKQYRIGQTEYSLNGDKINIDGFVVGNEHSIDGRLFFREYETLIQWSNFGEGRRKAVERGQLPRMGEFSMTEMFTRLQWRVAKDEADDILTGIGALLSTALDGDIPPHGSDPKPAVLWWHQDEEGWFEI